MNAERWQELAARYADLRIAIIGDFCLDRYLEIDPARAEVSIETGLPVHNVVQVRAQPGAAGTILNNLCALGVRQIEAVGFCGEDGEGYELQRALRAKPGVSTEYFRQTPERRTFTYTKPLVLELGQPPRELSRLDTKNWTPTPPVVTAFLADALAKVRNAVDAIILMDQVDLAETGVVTAVLLARLAELEGAARRIPILADSRRGLRGYPACTFKMNAAELSALTGLAPGAPVEEIGRAAAALAARNQRPVFVTMAERGLLGATPDGEVEHVNALPVRGPIDVVGAGDSVTANLAAALAAGATLREALELAAVASSIVIHQLGTSGAASARMIAEALPQSQA